MPLFKKKTGRETFNTLFMLRSFLFLLLLVFLQNTLPAQTLRPRYISMKSKSGGYYEYLPSGYTASKKYPLVLYIHGNSERGAGDSIGLFIWRHQRLCRLEQLERVAIAFVAGVALERQHNFTRESNV